jgi:hypothetical protein
MAGGINFYEIELSEVKRQDFEKFMLEEVFPAVGRGPNRVGSVTSLRLLKDVQDRNTYIWAIGWDGLRLYEGFVATAFEKLRSFGADIAPLASM